MQCFYIFDLLLYFIQLLKLALFEFVRIKVIMNNNKNIVIGVKCNNNTMNNIDIEYSTNSCID